MKPHRTCNLTHLEEADCSLLTIRVGNEVSEYLLEDSVTDDAELAVRVENRCSGAVYYVELYGSHGYHRCTCIGFEHRGTCRHIEALVALHRRGMLCCRV